MRGSRARGGAGRVRHQADVEQALRSRAGLHAGEVHAEARVGPVAERDVAVRLAVDVENDGIYLLVTADSDRRLAGNLNRWPVA